MTEPENGDHSIGLVPDDGHWTAPATVRVGARAQFVEELGNAPFIHSGRAWRQCDAPAVRDARVILSIQQVPLPGVARAGDEGSKWCLSFDDIRSKHSPGIPLPLGPGQWLTGDAGLYTTRTWERIDPDDHHPVCVACQLLWPCEHSVSVAADRASVRFGAGAAMTSPCEHCGTKIGTRMSIRFGALPSWFDPARHETTSTTAAPTLVVVDDDYQPVAAATESDRDRSPVVFCGRRGPCRDAAYEWAQANNWTLPVERDDNRDRPKTVIGTRGARR